MKMETSHLEDDKMRVLYDASYEGCVPILNTLIQQDPLILHKIHSTTIFTETPLHISALLGHLEFTKLLLAYKPKLVLELDSFRSTALHLASAEGHIHIVKELLQTCDHACLIPDQQGRIPLHYAVIRGRTNIVLELISAKPESLWILDQGKTVFHLCMMYSHLEVLKALMDLDIDACMLLSLRDSDGNTIVDLAIMLKQVDIIRFILSIPAIREAAGVENEAGFAGHKQVFKSLHIQIMLMNSSIKKIQDSKRETPPRPPPSTTIPQKVWRKILNIMERNLKNNGNWLEEMRGNLSLVATVISTITFQAVNNPPGGFVQQGINPKDHDDPLGCFYYKDGGKACPGDAVSAINYPHYFHPYLKYNTIAFISSLTVVLILVSGVPLKHKAVMWMLSIAMWVTLTFLTLTYFDGLYMVTPDGELFDSAWKMVRVSLRIWIGFLGVAALLITWRLIIWLGKKRLKKIKVSDSS